MTVWKFKLPINDEVTLPIPRGAELLCVQMQDGVPCLWAKVDQAAGHCQRTFRWRGTGHPAGNVGIYVGTVQVRGGALVFHLFVDREPAP